LVSSVTTRNAGACSLQEAKLAQDIHDGALDTGLGPHGVDVAAEQAVMAPSCLSECPLSGEYRGQSGHIAGIVKTALMTRCGHSEAFVTCLSAFWSLTARWKGGIIPSVA
jgi:hypothetical protein